VQQVEQTLSVQEVLQREVRGDFLLAVS
jgi:hypothetical protein